MTDNGQPGGEGNQRQEPGPLRLLFVEDSPDDVELMLRAISRGGLTIAASQRVETEAGLRAALVEQWDAVISDYNLPTFSGPVALAILSEQASEVPCIIASGAIGEEAAAALMRLGAVDFVTKDHLDRLAESLRRSISNAVERRRRAEAEARLTAARDRAETLRRQLSEFEERRARVIELNDDVLQRLVVAEAHIKTGHLDEAEAAISEALVAVRDVMTRLLPDGIKPGMLRRDKPMAQIRRSL